MHWVLWVGNGWLITKGFPWRGSRAGLGPTVAGQEQCRQRLNRVLELRAGRCPRGPVPMGQWGLQWEGHRARWQGPWRPLYLMGGRVDLWGRKDCNSRGDTSRSIPLTAMHGGEGYKAEDRTSKRRVQTREEVGLTGARGNREWTREAP